MRDSEILWAARDRVARGWCQNVGRDQLGNVCAVGALGDEIQDRFGVPNDVLRWDLIDHLRATLGGPIVEFNDKPETTKQDVLNLFEKTALRLEEYGL